MSFDKITSGESLELKSAVVSVKGSDEAEYKFTVNELTPYEMGYCLDEFKKVDFVALVARSVRDEDGNRMTIKQAQNLPDEVFTKFLKAYDELVENPKKKDQKNS